MQHLMMNHGENNSYITSAAAELSKQLTNLKCDDLIVIFQSGTTCICYSAAVVSSRNNKKQMSPSAYF